jgi:hypothetical protein
MQTISASQMSLASQHICVTAALRTHPDCLFTPLGCDVGATPLSFLRNEAFSIDWRLPSLLEEYSPRRGHHAERVKSSEEMV